MIDTLEIDTRGMSCSQATFLARGAMVQNSSVQRKIFILVSNDSACESIMRACKKFTYSVLVRETEQNDFLLIFTPQ